MLPVFVINLDRRPDRWAAMSAQMERLGIEAVRIPAVDARLLAAQEEWERTTNGNPPFWRINLGSAANMLGHGRAMSELLRSDAPAALILEDDAALAPDTPSLLGSVDWWPSGAHVVRLEASLPSGPRWRKAAPLWRSSGRTPSGRGLHRLERWCPGSAAYLIDRRGAQIALAAFADPDNTVDKLLFDFRYSRAARRLRTVQVLPAMARQREEDRSDQAAWRQAAELQGRERRVHRLRRNLRALPYKARVQALFALGMVRKVRISYSDDPPGRPC